jgi:hypothetical protein
VSWGRRRQSSCRIPYLGVEYGSKEALHKRQRFACLQNHFIKLLWSTYGKLMHDENSREALRVSVCVWEERVQRRVSNESRSKRARGVQPCDSDDDLA